MNYKMCLYNTFTISLFNYNVLYVRESLTYNTTITKLPVQREREINKEIS